MVNDKNSTQFPFDTWNNFRMAQRLSEQLHTFFGKVWKSLRKIVENMQKYLGRFQKLLSKQEENLMHQLIWLRKSWQVYTPTSIKVASEKNDAWSMFHSPRCTIVASVVNYVPATMSLETQKANAANASMLCQQNVKTMYFKTLNPRLFNLRQWFEVRFFSVVICKCCKFSTSLPGSGTWEFWMELKKIKFKVFVEQQ